MIFLRHYNNLLTTLHNLFIRNLFSFKGRVNRRDFIIFNIIYLFIGIILDCLGYFTIYFFNFMNEIVIANSLITLIYLIPDIFIKIRRMHDINFSGWILFKLLIAFLLLALISPFLSMLFYIMFIIIIPIFLMLKKGTEGINDYGEPPEY
ncbi:MAG: DUF805 domain-containing protein [Candidatus Megaira endosymbiont of Carteria cerasiformis]|nr:DUF805 domain-containing protein [Candidatus Megaera polyxenophila]